MRSRSLRTRLTISYAMALTVGLILFAVLSIVLMDRAFKLIVDQQLHTAVAAIASIVDTGGEGGDLAIESNDRLQFARIVGIKLDGALIDNTGTVLLSTVAVLPPVMTKIARSTPSDSRLKTQTALGPAGDSIRVASIPFKRGAKSGGVALVWRADDPIEDINRPATIAFAIAIPIIVALATLAGSLITRRGLRPLTALAAIASDIEANDLNRRLHAPQGEDELGRLCATFDRMLDRLQAAFERQRRFTADASHELRAPLSVIRAEADLALRKPRDGAEYRHALEGIASEADRLESLIGDLLTVARADAGGASRTTLVDIAALARGAANRMVSVADAKGVLLHATAPDYLPVLADADAIGRVPVVLLDNAVKFSHPGGVIWLAVERDGVNAVVRVRDDGPGFTDEGLKNATSRFWREDSARGRGGSGLGLAIAQAIVEQAGGTMVLANAPDGGAEITVRLPLATNST